jgi:hypothetical protein
MTVPKPLDHALLLIFNLRSTLTIEELEGVWLDALAQHRWENTVRSLEEIFRCVSGCIRDELLVWL